MAVFRLWLRFVLLGGLWTVACVHGRANTVVTELLSSWPSTPLLLEATELAAQFDGGQTGFWEFVAAVGAGTRSDRQVYDAAVAAGAKLLPRASHEAFVLGLHARSASPAVAASLQIAQEQLLVHHASAGAEGLAACASGHSPFVMVPGAAICAVSDVAAMVAAAHGREALTIHDVDHVFPGATVDAAAPAAVLYVCLPAVATETFQAWHTELGRLAEAGQVTYVLRHHCTSPGAAVPPTMRLAGYGVELAVKKTEYTAVDDTKIDAQAQATGEEDVSAAGDDSDYAGFRFGELQRLHPEHAGDLQKFRDHLAAQASVISQLKKWELQDLAMQAASLVAASVHPVQVLQDTSENFPVLAAQLTRQAINTTLQDEVVHNQRILARNGLEDGAALVLINSLMLDAARLDLHTLLATLRREARALDKLEAIGLSSDLAAEVLRLVPTGGLSAGEDPAASVKLDMRSSAVSFFNDLEQDDRYRRWSGSLMDILRPAMPGQPRYVAKNMFTAVLVLDVSQPETLAAQLVAMQVLVEEKNLPVRFGVVLFTTEDGPPGSRSDTVYSFRPDSSFAADNTAPTQHEHSAPAALIRGFSVLLADSRQAAFDWLLTLAHHLHKGNAALTVALVRQSLERESVDWTDLALPEHVKFQAQGYAFVYGRGLSDTVPCLLFNGQRLPRFDEETLLQAMQGHLPTLQRAAYYGELTDTADILHFLMTRSGVLTRVSPWTQAEGRALRRPLEAGAVPLYYLTHSGDTQAPRALTVWVVADLSTAMGQRAAFEVLRRQLKGRVMRVALIHTGAASDPVARTVQALVQGSPAADALDMVGHYLAHLLSGHTDALVKAVPKKDQRQAIVVTAASVEVQTALEGQAQFAVRVVGLGAGQTGLVVNLQLLGPFKEAPVVSDMRALESLYGGLAKSLTPILTKASKAMGKPRDGNRLSDMLMQTAALLKEMSKENAHSRRLPANFFKGIQTKAAMLTLAGPGSQPAAGTVYHDVVAVLDPLSKEAQVVVPYLSLLASLASVRVRVLLNPKVKVSDLPLNRFYRTVLPKMTFNDQGELGKGPIALFSGLPAAPLLTLGLHAPSAWMVQAVEAVYDLDNIHLETATGGVRGIFALKYILIEGNCLTTDTRQPTPGLQFQSGSLLRNEVFDTIVMANLGYFQLKAQPGVWHMALRPGRSRDIFEIASSDGADSNSDLQQPVVVVNDFLGRFVQFQVRRRPGMENFKLLDDGTDGEQDTPTDAADNYSSAQGKNVDGWLSYLYQKMTGAVAGGKASQAATISTPTPVTTASATPDVESTAKARQGETINIFSLASGHLYERFLKIMMLSVFKNTRNPVKFWFLENCMSPTFKAFLPFMAQQYGFEYELVQYNWPAWLNSQSEKQRLIWGYKILFLDVLFPLDVKKIIFVDADQVVRADLKELLDLDLEGAVYGYTPFCDSRKEMDGFRFWNSGYWRNHLAGRPYHISALYVVDLVRFRQFAAGDRLRGQYQGLSRDPNSLSNLDQDLPNNMIHQVPIKSLPQDWLWCETWCSDTSKTTAKTIDLCNNPLTKEPKLNAAVRIVAEWRDLDWEAGNTTQRFLQSVGSAPTRPTAVDEPVQHSEL